MAAAGGESIYRPKALGFPQNVWGIYPQVGGPWWRSWNTAAGFGGPGTGPLATACGFQTAWDLNREDLSFSEPEVVFCCCLNQRNTAWREKTRALQVQEVSSVLEGRWSSLSLGVSVPDFERLAASLQNTRKSKITCKSKCTKNPVFEMFISAF